MVRSVNSRPIRRVIAAACLCLGVIVIFQQSVFATTGPTFQPSSNALSTVSTTFAGSEVLSCATPSYCLTAGVTPTKRLAVVSGNPSSWTGAGATTLLPGGTLSTGRGLNAQCIQVGWCWLEVTDSNNSGRLYFGDPTTWTNTSGFVAAPAYLGQSLECFSTSQCISTIDNAFYLGSPSAGFKKSILTLPTSVGSSWFLNSENCWSYSGCAVLVTGSGSNQWNGVASFDPSTLGSIRPNVHKLSDNFSPTNIFCATAANCLVWGTKNDTAAAAIYGGNPDSWDSQQPQDLTTPVDTNFTMNPYGTSLQCVSLTSCFAVNPSNGSVDTFTISTWGNADAWAVPTAVDTFTPPTNLTGSYLRSTWCSSPTMCVAVWDGSTTSAAATVSAIGTPSSPAFQDISRSGPDAATSTASSLSCRGSWCGNLAQGGSTYVIAGASANWSHAQVVQLGSTPLTSMACVSATFCVAVGGTSIAVGNPSTWSASSLVQLTLDGAKFGISPGLNSVSCVSTTSCVAVGTFELTGNPSTWTSGNARPLSTYSLTTGAYSQVLSSVNCVTPTACVAVGSNLEALFRYYVGNPTTWTTATVKSINLSHWVTSGFTPEFDVNSVSCASAKWCVAAGGAKSYFQGKPLIIVGNPALWSTNSVQTPTIPTMGPTSVAAFSKAFVKSQLTQVAFTSASCTSTRCLLVGRDSVGNPIELSAAVNSLFGPSVLRPSNVGPPQNIGSGFQTVSCAGAACFVAGYSDQGIFLAAQ